MNDHKRYYVKYTFFKVDNEWRRISVQRREKAKKEFLDSLQVFSASANIKSYSLMGTRGDTDLMLWMIAPDLETLQVIMEEIFSTDFGKYLSIPHSFLAMTRQSPYTHTHHDLEVSEKSDLPYLFVYPFVKTNEWYQLAKPERQEIMDEHFAIGHRYPDVKIHTSYSFGIDDQEFVLGFETNNPGDFVDLVMELRESKARPFTLRDTPIFTCLRRPLGKCLDGLA